MGFVEKTLESEVIYKGKILSLRKDKVETKIGTSYREIIEHKGGSVAIPITKDKKIVFVKQYRKAMENDMIELPAGKIEEGEDPIETMERELEEETGYFAREMRLIGKFNPSVGYTSETLYIYLAKGLEKGEQNLDGDEDLEIIEIPVEEAIEMVVRGEITDGKTMTGVLLAKYYI